DADTQDKIYNGIAGGTNHLPSWTVGVRGLQTGISWPKWTTHIPYVPFHELKLLNSHFLNLDFPAWLVEQAIPLGCMVGLPIVLCLILRKLYGPLGMRVVLDALFTGFITVYVELTIVGT